MKRLLKIFTLTLAASLSPAAMAQNAIDLPQPRLNEPFNANEGFVVPNENYPGRMLQVLKDSPGGAYVSVGTERGFMGAAMTPEAEALVLIDVDPDVVIYNRINILLLRMARSRGDYLDLRMHPERRLWESEARHGGLSEADTQFLLSRLDDWKTDVAENRRFKTFHHHPTSNLQPFAKANYLFNEPLFRKIKSMADRGKIFTGLLDLSDGAQAESLVGQMSAAGLPLSVLDLSNAWWSGYIPHEKLARTLEIFDRIAGPESRLVLTGFAVFGVGSNDFQYFISDFNGIRRKRGRFLKYLNGLTWANMLRLPGYTYFNGRTLTSPGTCDDVLKGKTILHRGVR